MILLLCYSTHEQVIKKMKHSKYTWIIYVDETLKAPVKATAAKQGQTIGQFFSSLAADKIGITNPHGVA